MLPTGQPPIQSSNRHVQFAQPYVTPFPSAHNGSYAYWQRPSQHVLSPFNTQISRRSFVNQIQRQTYGNSCSHNPLIRRFDVSPSGRPENGCLAIWNNVRAVPLSFDAQANMDEEYSSISDYSCDTNSEDERDVQNTNEDEKYKQLSSMHAQNDVVNSVLNPGNRKRDIVSSWFTDSCFNINNVEKYQSPVLIPSYKRSSRCQRHHRPTREERFASRHPHLVEIFGNAYIRWRESQATEEVKPAEDFVQFFQRVNYSQLYDNSFPSHVMEESRKDFQIKEAVKSITM